MSHLNTSEWDISFHEMIWRRLYWKFNLWNFTEWGVMTVELFFNTFPRNLVRDSFESLPWLFSRKLNLAAWASHSDLTRPFKNSSNDAFCEGDLTGDRRTYMTTRWNHWLSNANTVLISKLFKTKSLFPGTEKRWRQKMTDHALITLCIPKCTKFWSFKILKQWIFNCKEW